LSEPIFADSLLFPRFYGFNFEDLQLRCAGVRLTFPPVLTTVHVGTEELLFIALAILSFFPSGLFRAIFITCAALSERYFPFSLLSLQLY
jgi:hypothetical protein